MPGPRRIAAVMALLPLALVLLAGRERSAPAAAAVPDRSPVDLVLTADESLLITANQTSHSISLIETATGKVLVELPCGEKPAALALTPDGKTVLVSGTYSGDVSFYRLDGQHLSPLGKVQLGFEPRDIAISPDSKLAYVALTTAHKIAILDVATRQSVGVIEVGKWPRYLALSPDGSRLGVGLNGEGGVGVVDTAARKQLWIEDFVGINLGRMHPSKDGKYVYFPWMVYRHNPITPNNIKIGWVLASRIARVRLDKPARREAISLDPQGLAVSDPHGMAISPDESTLVCAASGTHELLVYRLTDLPFQDYGGPGDHIHPDLLKNKERFDRIPLGGRPMAAKFSRDGKTVYVANYLSNRVQVVDVPARKVTRTIDLGGPSEPSLVRKGEAIFYDGKRSLDQWYSCHSCHYEGHTNAVTMDTRNDGRFGNFKTVLSLRHVGKTGPYFWHGWQESLDEAVRKSMIDSMLGPNPSPDDVTALRAFLESLTDPPNPYRINGELSEAAKRGEAVFRSEKAECARCHPGPSFTDNKLHNVHTGERGDVYPKYNPPSLMGVYSRLKLLHDGRATSLQQLLTGPHNPETFVGKGALTDQELKDLIEYLKSL